jgi:hypothetical protein
MQIKKSELRSVIKEQVAAFFVTPQPFGTVSRNTNLEGSLRKFDTDEVDEKELTKVIKQTMAELEEEASKRMRSTKLKESKINGKAKGHGNRVKEVEQHWMTKFESILKRKAPKLVGRVEEERAQYMQTMGYTPEDAVRDIVRPGSLERSNHNKIEKSKCAEGMVLDEISGVDSLKPNDPHTPEDEAEKDAADDVMEAGPKKNGGRPRGGPHIENVRFWDLPQSQLRDIIKDASEAVKLNPTARKANKWADEINDAVSVLSFRKKKGIKESVMEAAAEGKRITALRKIVKTQKPGKVDRQIIDLYNASDLVKLYDGLPGKKGRLWFEQQPIGKLVEFLKKVWRQGLA